MLDQPRKLPVVPVLPSIWIATRDGWLDESIPGFFTARGSALQWGPSPVEYIPRPTTCAECGHGFPDTDTNGNAATFCWLLRMIRPKDWHCADGEARE